VLSSTTLLSVRPDLARAAWVRAATLLTLAATLEACGPPKLRGRYEAPSARDNPVALDGARWPEPLQARCDPEPLEGAFYRRPYVQWVEDDRASVLWIGAHETPAKLVVTDPADRKSVV
jgi:hypothetical protein